jgi:glycosyltransferase involved in cell wall biosynthesis
MISVLILTKNEEQDLPGCLQSVAWSDDVHVFDSHSTDNTVAIAEAQGAMVIQRTFDGYASQRNAALHGLPFRHPWVLILDADERIPQPTADALKLFALAPANDAVAARLRRRDFFLGTWLKHAQISPYYIRLVRPERVRYEREINEVLKVDGEVVDLAEPFDHFPFSKGLRHWIEKHNTYSTMEARIAWAARHENGQVSWRSAFIGNDFNERRIHQKEIFYRMPFRPLVKWLYMVIIRRAFLDGRAGLVYAALQAIYEYFIVLKTRELDTAGTVVPVSKGSDKEASESPARFTGQYAALVGKSSAVDAVVDPQHDQG